MRLLLVQGMSGEGDVLAEELEEEAVQVDVVRIRNGVFSEKGRSRFAKKLKQSLAEGIVLVMTGEKKLVELIPFLQEISHMPVLVMGNDKTPDCGEEIHCLELGAGDYLSFGVPVHVMILRMQRLIQLYQGTCQPFSYQRGLVELSGRQDYLWQSVPLGLTKKEYEILHFLLHSREDIVTKETLLRQIWQKTLPEDSFVLTTMIRKLRQKLEPVPMEIVNCYGRGYHCRWHFGDAEEYSETRRYL